MSEQYKLPKSLARRIADKAEYEGEDYYFQQNCWGDLKDTPLEKYLVAFNEARKTLKDQLTKAGVKWY